LNLGERCLLPLVLFWRCVLNITTWIQAIFSVAVFDEIISIFTIASPLFLFTAPFLLFAVIKWVFRALSGSDTK